MDVILHMRKIIFILFLIAEGLFAPSTHPVYVSSLTSFSCEGGFYAPLWFSSLAYVLYDIVLHRYLCEELPPFALFKLRVLGGVGSITSHE